MGGAYQNVIFSLRKTALAFTGKCQEPHAKLSRASLLTLQELIIDGRFELGTRTLLRKPDFLFGDLINRDEEALNDGNSSGSVRSGSDASSCPTWKNVSFVVHSVSFSISTDGLGADQDAIWCFSQKARKQHCFPN